MWGWNRGWRKIFWFGFSSLNSKSLKSIIAIFAKLSERDKYHELVYVSNVVGIYKKDEGLLDKLDNNIQMKFLEIITRH